jgi:hypothetical protein
MYQTQRRHIPDIIIIIFLVHDDETPSSIKIREFVDRLIEYHNIGE